MHAEGVRELGAHTYCIEGPVNLGLYERGGEAALIDSGGDKDAGRNVRKILDGMGLHLDIICATHSNADHVGGNRYLQNLFSCRIGSSLREKPFIESPQCEPMLLWGGYPHRAITGKFLQAQPSAVTDILTPEHTVDPFDIEVTALPGHFVEMLGFTTPDSVFFIGDAVFSEKIIRKYRFFYVFDVAGFLTTLDLLEHCTCRLFVPSHAEPVEDIRGLAALNREAVLSLAQLICEICREPKSPDEIIEEVSRRLSLTMNHAQYVLVGSSVRSYLSYLERENRMEAVIGPHLVRWISR
jgi:glyoxylase-like metal-dependent hydrolase (beta-lactamase superfamily II)